MEHSAVAAVYTDINIIKAAERGTNIKVFQHSLGSMVKQSDLTDTNTV